MVLCSVFSDEPFETRLRLALRSTSAKALVALFGELTGEVPSPRRDARMARVALELAEQAGGREAERWFLTGYSYARTARDPEVRARAERLRERFGSWW